MLGRRSAGVRSRWGRHAADRPMPWSLGRSCRSGGQPAPSANITPTSAFLRLAGEIRFRNRSSTPTMQRPCPVLQVEKVLIATLEVDLKTGIDDVVSVVLGDRPRVRGTNSDSQIPRPPMTPDIVLMINTIGGVKHVRNRSSTPGLAR